MLVFNYVMCKSVIYPLIVLTIPFSVLVACLTYKKTHVAPGQKYGHTKHTSLKYKRVFVQRSRSPYIVVHL